MGIKKQRRKLVRIQEKADACTTREEAQAILQKAKKAQSKIQVLNLIEDFGA